MHLSMEYQNSNMFDEEIFIGEFDLSRSPEVFRERKFCLFAFSPFCIQNCKLEEEIISSGFCLPVATKFEAFLRTANIPAFDADKHDNVFFLLQNRHRYCILILW